MTRQEAKMIRPRLGPISIAIALAVWTAAGQAAAQDQAWLLGDDVLVAPVVTQGARARSVYLPAGCWQREGAG